MDMKTVALSSLGKGVLSLSGIAGIKAWQSLSREKFLVQKQALGLYSELETSVNCTSSPLNKTSNDDLINELLCRSYQKKSPDLTEDNCKKIKRLANNMCSENYVCLEKKDFNQLFEDANTALILAACWTALSGISIDLLKAELAKTFQISPATINSLLQENHIDTISQQSNILATTAAQAGIAGLVTVAVPTLGIQIFKRLNNDKNIHYKEMFDKLRTKYAELEQRKDSLDYHVEQVTSEYNNCVEGILSESIGALDEARSQNIKEIELYGVKIRTTNRDTAISDIRNRVAPVACRHYNELLNAAKQGRKLSIEQYKHEKEIISESLKLLASKEGSLTDPETIIEETLRNADALNGLFAGLLLQEVPDGEITKIYEELHPLQTVYKKSVASMNEKTAPIRNTISSGLSRVKDTMAPVSSSISSGLSSANQSLAPAAASFSTNIVGPMKSKMSNLTSSASSLFDFGKGGKTRKHKHKITKRKNKKIRRR